jgi:hypothetical protein
MNNPATGAEFLTETKTRKGIGMKTHETRIVAISIIAIVGLWGCKGTGAAKSDPAIEVSTSVLLAEGIPGGVIMDTLSLEAEVVAINQKKRTATLLLPGGEKLPVTVGPEAVNFDQVAKGSRVRAVVHEELAVYLGDEDSEADDGAVMLAVGAEKGDQPGGMVAESLRTTATVTAVDLEAHTATLNFEDGSVETVDVRPDVRLTEHSVGAKVVFEITSAVIVSVEKVE